MIFAKMIGSAHPYIPQRSPMIMIDYLIHADEVSGSGQFKVTENNLFVKQGKLTESGLIENIAQTAAAWAGYRRYLENIEVTIGYIASLNNVRIDKLPPIKSIVNTSIEIQHTLLGITIILGKSFLGTTQLCECELKIFSETN